VTASERSLGIQWVVANVVGWLIGFGLCEAIQSFISTVLVDGLVIGSAVGIAQWLVLRRWMSPVGWWVLLSIVGFGVGKALAEAILPSASTLPWYAATGAIIGASVGVAQWPVLRRHVSSAAWWVPATVVAWIAGWSAIGIAEHAVDWPTLTTYVVGGVGAALAGTITAIALIWLRRIPRVSGGVSRSASTNSEP
jgi:hypothetical protein